MFVSSWEPEQKTLYIIVSSRDKAWKEIVIFPQIRTEGEKAQLSFTSDHQHILSGSVEEVTETRATFIWQAIQREERLTIHAITDKDFESICEQRRKHNWAVPRSKEELFSWYANHPNERKHA